MALDPNNVQVLRQMAAIHRQGAQWQRVGETLQRALDVAVANDDRKMILVDLGELLDKNMGQTDQGIAYYKRALEIDSLYLPALSALERIYDERQPRGSRASSRARCRRSRREQIAARKLRIASSTSSRSASSSAPARSTARCSTLDGTSLPRCAVSSA
jgi:tetratricopeptide (TPR) repeat protein